MSGSSRLATMDSRVTSLGRLCELLTVILVAACLFVYLFGGLGGWGFVLAAGLLGLAIIPYQAALRYATALKRVQRVAVKSEVRRAAALNYRVTPARLKVLEKTGVPEDVRDALERLMKFPPLDEEQFLKRLALSAETDLGWERTNEFKETILRYTKHESVS